MDTTTDSVEQVTLSEVMGMASWERQRSSEELKSFISQRESVIFR